MDGLMKKNINEESPMANVKTLDNKAALSKADTFKGVKVSAKNREFNVELDEEALLIKLGSQSSIGSTSRDNKFKLQVMPLD
jgi:hypothetical protein